MKQGRYGWGDIRHECLICGGAMLDAQSHKHKRNVGVVGIPCAMVGAFHSFGICSGFVRDARLSRFFYNAKLLHSDLAVIRFYTIPAIE